MSHTISILEATEADLPAMEALLVELINTLEDSEGFDPQRLRQNCRLLINRADCHLLVAKIKEAVVGLINFNTRQTATTPGLTGLIDELIVTKSYRGQGIGRRLISAAIDKCRQLGCHELEVSTEKADTKAREFYKRCGFKGDAVLFEMHFAQDKK